MVDGVIVWALHFALSYAYTAYACARGTAATVPWVVAAVTLFGVAAAAVLVVRSMQREAGFNEVVTRGVALLALLAMLWEGAVALGMPPCVPR